VCLQRLLAGALDLLTGPLSRQQGCLLLAATPLLKDFIHGCAYSAMIGAAATALQPAQATQARGE
jgi:hypothetical protein